ncbi:GNAT family N-acetyltransferase [Brevibacillus dissolubilis]|uniref:GNAT family N-acetyltransferase n=1 Tax=Brevibacillus dissolubilis TaxID=1844116 RepID=UPI001116F11D|nr:GNAT family protein [Brevibacillus dissolubilis]
MLHIQPVTLEGKLVRLEPLSEAHAAGILEAAQVESIWDYMTFIIRDADDVQQYIQNAFAAQEKGTDLVFSIFDKESGKLVGGTRFMAISSKDGGLEIGTTWLNPSVQKTGINTECKYLLLQYCFEVLGCLRVQLKTDGRNLNSQRAIARIGAQKEGVLRKHMVVRDGFVRDTVMFSVIDTEWPQVKTNLEAKMQASYA